MIGVLGALVASLAWGTSDFLGGRASRGRHVLAVLAITRPTGLAGVGLLVLLLPTGALGDRWPFAVLAGVVLLAGMLCLYRALAIGPMPVVAPIFTTAAIIPALVGIVRGEEPTLLVGAGLVLAGGGAILAARTPREAGASAGAGRGGTAPPPADGPRPASGVAYAVAAAALIGLGLTLVDHAAEADPLRTILVERATETVIVLSVLALGWRRLGGDLLPIWPIPLIGLIDLTANVGFAFASRGGLLPVVAVLASLYPVVTVLLAWAILHERTTRTQLVGAALTLVGVGVVAAAGAG